MANLTLYVAKCLITSYTSILAPLLPLIMQQMKLSLTQAGALISLFSFFNSLFQPVCGLVQDRFGFFPFLCITPLWVGGCMGVLGIVPSYEWLITLLILAGIGICFFHPASFAAVGCTDAGRRSIAISYLMLASSLGFVVGPALISLFTARCGMEKLYLIVIPGAIVTAALLKFFSRETGDGPRQNAKRRMNPFRAVLSPIFPLFLSALAISITAMNLYSLVPILFRQRGVSIETVGLFLSLFALGCAVGPLLGSVLARRCGKSVMMVIASACSIAFLPLFVLTQGPFVLNISLFLFLGTALMMPISVLIDMAQEKAPEYLGTASSLLGGFAWGCGGLLVIVFAKLAEVVGIQTVVNGLVLFPLLNLGLVSLTKGFRTSPV
ncbi:MAG: MFS transporter [Syntrophobacterales bacterium]|nr:MFS transporter [Syntrophobacterales bacterium]